MQKAKDYAFLLLKYRLRSEKEIFERLKKKKFDDNTVRLVLSFLKDKGFVDDEAFAKAWVGSRIKRPYGFRRISRELNLKGIDPRIINNQLEEVRKDYRESEIVRELAQKRFARLKDLERKTAKRRVYSYLLRRGFSPEAVIDALEEF